MPEKERRPEPAESDSLMERIAPAFEMADRLGPVNQDIDQKALSDWICGGDEPFNSNEAAASEVQGESILSPDSAEACLCLDQDAAKKAKEV